MEFDILISQDQRQKLDAMIDNTDLLVDTLLKHIHECDHSCCVKDILTEIYEK